jgi:ABC-2 type transport system permease protein
MKKILSIIWKDTILRFTSKSELLFFLVLPIFFTFVLAGGTGNQNVDNRIRLLVVDQAQSRLTQQIIAGLQDSDSVRPEVMTLDEAEEIFSNREASTLLIIPPDCTDENLLLGNIVLELRMLPNNLNGQAASRSIQAVLYRMGSAAGIALQAVTEAEKNPAFRADDKQSFFADSMAYARELLDSAPLRMEAVLGGTVDPIEYDPASNSSAGQLITWVFIPLIGISSTFAYERQLGTLRRLLTSPTGRGTYLLGVILGNVLWALIQMVLLMIFGTFVMGVNWASQPLALGIVMVAACLAAAALGTMLGTFVKTAEQANGLSIMIGMVMALLGGCWYPLELFPQVVQQVVKVLPTTWAMNGMLDLLLRRQGVAGILPEAGVLLGFALVFFVIGIWRFRYE